MELSLSYLFFILEPFMILTGVLLLSVFPGIAVTMHLKLDASLKLLLGIILNLLLMYLLMLLKYALELPGSFPGWIYLFACAWSILHISRRFDAFKLSGLQMLPCLTAWISLALWIFALQVPMITYGGTGWFGDWYEHYHRTRLFLDQLPASTKFLDQWSLPARGPLFNADSALMLGYFGNEFWIFQIVSTVFNTLAVIPLGILSRRCTNLPENTALAFSVIFLGLAPFAVQQEACTITKFFTLALILSAIAFYLEGTRLGKVEVTLWSLPIFATGMLAHYLVLPFAIFFGIHVLWVLWKRQELPKLTRPFLLSIMILSTWFGYLFPTFGWKETVTANSTLGEKLSSEQSFSNFIGNLTATFIPYPFRHGFSDIGRAPIVKSYKVNDPQIAAMSDLLNIPSSVTGAIGFAGMLGLLLIAGHRWVKRKCEASNHAGKEIKEVDHVPGPGFWAFFSSSEFQSALVCIEITSLRAWRTSIFSRSFAWLSFFSCETCCVFPCL